MIEISVSSQNENYSIFIGTDILDETIKDFISRNSFSSILIISDSNVASLYFNKLREILTCFKEDIFTYDISPGETNKNMGTGIEILNYCIQIGLDRKSLILALGGGVVGDMAGFVASTYMRGISYIQIPTTLMAMIDSSIGGKVAVNLGETKNIIGSFYSPKLVVVDTSFLVTLDREEILSGIGEAIKYGLIDSYSFLCWLRDKRDEIINLHHQSICHLVQYCCSVKAKIVSMDYKEGGIRAILNLGHTIGHGIEAATSFNQYSHGRAVALGIIFESRLALVMHLISKDYYDEIFYIISAFNLHSVKSPLEVEDIMRALKKDKKKIKNNIRFALPTARGVVSLMDNIDLDIVKQVLIEGVD